MIFFFLNSFFENQILLNHNIEHNACLSSPCKNGGRCNVSNGGNSFTCACINGFTGQFCQTRKFLIQLFSFFLFFFLKKSIIIAPGGPCDPNPCLNGGTCTPGAGGTFTCTCSGGFTGPNCQAGKL